MAKVAAYHSVNEEKKPAAERVYHDDNDCRSGRDIPKSERVAGTGGYRHCKNCD